MGKDSKMNAKEIANEGIVTQLAVVHTMLPKVKELIDQQADRIAELSKNVDELEEELLKTPQIKELSDEEIDEVLYSMDWAHDPVKFARAILKKASEK